MLTTAAGLLLLASAPGLPRTASPKMSAWLVFDAGASLADFRSHAAEIDTVSAEWIVCGRDGHAVRRPKPTAEEKRTLMGIARANHVRVLALASNADGGGFSPVGVEKMLAGEATMRAGADELVKIVRDERLDGIDLDYELLLAKDRNSFSRFVTILSRECHANHLFLAIALHPKESEPGTWDGPQAQDYAAIGKAVDLARVMTYDEHWATSEAGSVSSPGWTERIVRFAGSVIPPRKLDVGVPGYGYDWVGKAGQDVTWDDFLGLTRLYGAPHRDPSSQELTLSYKDHTVYFPDAVSASGKFALAKQLGIHGLALWRLGTEDPATWNIFPAGGAAK